MDLGIFDVGHGFCGLLRADNGNTMLFDCGSDATKGVKPSSLLRRIGCREVHLLFISNYDEDHLSGLPELLASPDLKVRCLYRNRSVDASTLMFMKLSKGPLGPGAESMAGMIGSYTSDVPAWQMPIFPGIQWRNFCNPYPLFTDENNLSLVTFVHYENIRIVFPGDLEETGWRELLRLPEFRRELAQVNVFIASHHGRENGYCEQVFKYCWPEIIVVSDDQKAFDTQETVDRYRQHARGVRFTDGKMRYVLTTRRDGMICFHQNPGDSFGWVYLPEARVSQN